MPLTREQIERASDARIITVPCPELGGDICLRMMTVGERDSYELALVENEGKPIPDFRSELLSRTICDEAGNLLFPGRDGVESLKQRSADVMHKLWQRAMQHNALSEEEVRKIAGE